MEASRLWPSDRANICTTFATTSDIPDAAFTIEATICLNWEYEPYATPSQAHIKVES